MDRVGVEPTTSAHSILVLSAVDENISISTNAAEIFSDEPEEICNSLANSTASAFLSSFFNSGLLSSLFDKTREVKKAITLKSCYILSTSIQMVTTAEYIQIIAAGIYAIALFYTIITFRRTKRLDQITLSDRIFSELRELDRELAKIPPESQYDDARNQAYSRIFSTLDYFSFLVNQKMIDDRRLLEYMKPIIISYYEEIFMRHPSSINERDSKSYQQFRKFYLKLKK
jgi:hypothetical protein